MTEILTLLGTVASLLEPATFRQMSQVNFSSALLHPFRQRNPDYSILDLKSHYRGYRYASETIKMLLEKPDAILLADIFQQIARLGAIHPQLQPVASP